MSVSMLAFIRGMARERRTKRMAQARPDSLGGFAVEVGIAWTVQLGSESIAVADCPRSGVGLAGDGHIPGRRVGVSSEHDLIRNVGASHDLALDGEQIPRP